MIGKITMSGLITLLLITRGMGTDPDTVKKSREPRSHWRLTLRAHSKAIFNFGGRVGSDNPTTDINFTYDRKQWGFLVFKGQDLLDHGTFYNFALITVYKNFRLSDKWTMTPSIGSFLEEQNAIVDKGSDVVFLLTTSFRLNQHVTLEHMSLLGNLVFEPEERDWVNRFRLLYTHRHLDFVASTWHNNQVLDNSWYWSAGLSASYSRIRLADHLQASIGVSGLVMIHTSDPAINPQKHTAMVTISLMAFR